VQEDSFRHANHRFANNSDFCCWHETDMAMQLPYVRC
jgi:hypothetical protein